uniref:Uncharacterized protein n=1 Tax=Clandestinovirus TaxID=2831644 RepID=A0A8F8PJU0_9VIRU|nr:hypothetical protein KOM_12_38 [Clandestinovirus]
MSVTRHQPNYSTVESLINALSENNRLLTEELMGDSEANAFFGFSGYSNLYLSKNKITFVSNSSQDAIAQDWSSNDWNNINISSTPSDNAKVVKFDRQMLDLLTEATKKRFVAVIEKISEMPRQLKFDAINVPLADGIFSPAVTWNGYLLHKNTFFREKAWNPLADTTVFRLTNLNPYYSRKQLAEQLTLATQTLSWPISEQVEFVAHKLRQFNTLSGDKTFQTYWVLQVAKHLAVFANHEHLLEVYPLFGANSEWINDLFERTEGPIIRQCLDRLDVVDIFCVPAKQIQRALKMDE